MPISHYGIDYQYLMTQWKRAMAIKPTPHQEQLMLQTLKQTVIAFKLGLGFIPSRHIPKQYLPPGGGLPPSVMVNAQGMVNRLALHLRIDKAQIATEQLRTVSTASLPAVHSYYHDIMARWRARHLEKLRRSKAWSPRVTLGIMLAVLYITREMRYWDFNLYDIKADPCEFFVHLLDWNFEDERMPDFFGSGNPVTIALIPNKAARGKQALHVTAHIDPVFALTYSQITFRTNAPVLDKVSLLLRLKPIQPVRMYEITVLIFFFTRYQTLSAGFTWAVPFFPASEFSFLTTPGWKKGRTPPRMRPTPWGTFRLELDLKRALYTKIHMHTAYMEMPGLMMVRGPGSMSEKTVVHVIAKGRPRVPFTYAIDDLLLFNHGQPLDLRQWKELKRNW